jgi:hypothetical protein
VLLIGGGLGLEIVAGALQAGARPSSARSFGKGSVQMQSPLGSGNGRSG